jgi:hypothetical protein
MGLSLGYKPGPGLVLIGENLSFERGLRGQQLNGKLLNIRRRG